MIQITFSNGLRCRAHYGKTIRIMPNTNSAIGQRPVKKKSSSRLHPRPEDGAKYNHWQGQWWGG